MTAANYITLFRFLLVPVFIAAMLYYNASGRYSLPDETYRWVAVAAFLTAAISDAIDGYVARAFKQKSVLGSILDPMADKILVLAGLLMLSYVSVTGLQQLPIWFPVLVISRDVLLALGIGFVYFTMGAFEIKPHLTGKISTFLQMYILAVVLLKLPWIHIGFLTYACGFFALVSFIIYIVHGIFILRTSSAAKPTKEITN